MNCSIFWQEFSTKSYYVSSLWLRLFSIQHCFLQLYVNTKRDQISLLIITIIEFLLTEAWWWKSVLLDFPSVTCVHTSSLHLSVFINFRFNGSCLCTVGSLIVDISFTRYPISSLYLKVLLNCTVIFLSVIVSSIVILVLYHQLFKFLARVFWGLWITLKRIFFIHQENV